MIAIVAALLLIYYSKKPASVARDKARRVQATVVPEKQYKKSEDGKVVYLFDDGEDKGESGKPGEAVKPSDGNGGARGEDPKDDDDDYLF
ncbi:MAG: hypothetical protein LBG50_04555 [Clostridiales Family XIII bacterium]|jgi:hypothetical protein|nr:hypothetical protein [Clostridiales Family XIII bacterium]